MVANETTIGKLPLVFVPRIFRRSSAFLLCLFQPHLELDAPMPARILTNAVQSTNDSALLD
jgi:hypothetical protein